MRCEISDVREVRWGSSRLRPPLEGGFDIREILGERLLRRALEEEAGDAPHDSGRDGLRFAFERHRQSGPSTAIVEGDQRLVHRAMALRARFVVRTLHRVRDPHDLRDPLPEHGARFPPFEPGDSHRRALQDLHRLDCMDEGRRVLDVRHEPPDIRARRGDFRLHGHAHAATKGARSSARTGSWPRSFRVLFNAAARERPLR